MSVATGTVRGASPASNPFIYNVLSPATPDTEFTQALNANTKKFILRSRNGSRIKLAFISGDSSIKYITLEKYTVLEQEDLIATDLILYMQVNQANDVIEILEWT